MTAAKTQILDHLAIQVKLDRMATEICEKHTESDKIVLCGLNQRGFFLANTLAERVCSILPTLKVVTVQCLAPEAGPVTFEPKGSFSDNQVIVVDDVINSGRTLMQVLPVIFNDNPVTIETAFLAKREHRSFPVKADYVGISLATTLQEHVKFDDSRPQNLEVWLD
jgi:pyrimidine operon attenuation protein / uracil phosphoribosyltransferase